MTVTWFDVDVLPFSLFLLLATVVLIQSWFYWYIFFRLALCHRRIETKPEGGISVVICAHNEHPRLRDNLPAILQQDHPKFEVLVVNHSSDDDTQYLLSDLADRYSNLRCITVREDLNFFSGKKFPLSIGIKSAQYDHILLTDADCRPASPQWIRMMHAAFSGSREIVLGYGPYLSKKGLLNMLIRFDTAHIALQYLSYALTGIPYMGVGRNLAYSRNLFYRSKGFISHYKIISGDDDLFINRVATGNNTAIVVDPAACTLSEPKDTFSSWFLQKRRHLSTAYHYRFIHKLLLGSYSLTTLLYYLVAVMMLLMQYSTLPVIGLILLRIAGQYIVFIGCFRKLNEKDLAPFVLPFELALGSINLMAMVSNLFQRTNRWR
jgi:cellulose synthase/poly-beta-1,6-N-acetylglucosamine synthase-like glycosyltransferase